MTREQSSNPSVSTPTKQQLPKLSPAEFRIFNKMADHMNGFHNHFRYTWTTMYKACESSKRPSGMSLRQFINMGLEFCSHLDMHHNIEERHVFPFLATRMPAFRKELELLTQHKQIHKGLDDFQEYLEKCQSGEHELRMGEMKRLMDAFQEVLWQHLDEEVQELGAENMRLYWSLDEMRRFPFG